MNSGVSELLHRSNLLQYEAGLMEQGADDLQQLLDVSDDEFSSLLKAIGMANKPFHVKRFCKALGRSQAEQRREEDHISLPPTVTVFASRVDGQQSLLPLTDPHSVLMDLPDPLPLSMQSTSSLVGLTPTPSTTVTVTSTPPPPHSATITIPQPPMEMELDSSAGDEEEDSSRRVVQIDVSVELLNRLADETTPVQRKLGPSPFIPSMWDARRKEIIRSSSQVFTTSNSRRRNHELTEHESLMNEAAYRLCLWDPTLLVRREELFTLAKKLVKESGNSSSIQVKYSSAATFNSRFRGCPYPLQRGADGKFKACFEQNYDMRAKQISEVERLLAENVTEEQVKQVLLSEAKRQKDYSAVLQLQEEIATLGQSYRQLRTQLSKIKRKQRRAVRHQEIKRLKTEDTIKDVEPPLSDNYSSLHLLQTLPQELNETAVMVAAAVAVSRGDEFSVMGGVLDGQMSSELGAASHKDLPPVVAAEEVTTNDGDSSASSLADLQPQLTAPTFTGLGINTC